MEETLIPFDLAEWRKRSGDLRSLDTEKRRSAALRGALKRAKK